MNRIRLTAAALTILASSCASPQAGSTSNQPPQEVPPFTVKVSGHGQPMILIPGLSSSGAVWNETVAHYAPAYQCHALTLAGFAGQPPAPTATPFLTFMRDEIANYIRRERLHAPVLVGHSLGGVLALSLAAKYPDLVGKIVSVDGPPAPGALDNPKASPEDLKAMADEAAARYAKTTGAARRKMLETMVTSPEHMAEIVSWGPSDPETERNAIMGVITTDLRTDLANIRTPVLVLATWVGWGPEVNRDTVARAFQEQLRNLKSGQVDVAPQARHFLMYDDPQWMFEKMDRFLGQPPGGIENRAKVH